MEEEVTSAGSKHLNILLADDHAMVREALKFYLEELDSSVAVTAVASLREALEVSPGASKFDLVLLDFKMPGMNGLAGLDVAAEHFTGIPIVILSGVIDRHATLLAMEAGAAGVIPKDLGMDAMMIALKLVLSGEKYIPSMVLHGVKDGRFGPSEGGEGALQSLTDRQRDVLRLLTQGMPNKRIAQVLSIQEVTVKLHLSKVFEKLGASNRTEAVRIALDLGSEDGWRPAKAV